MGHRLAALSAAILAFTGCDVTLPGSAPAAWFIGRRWQFEELCGCPPSGCSQSLATRFDSSRISGTLDSLAAYVPYGKTDLGDTVWVMLERGDITMVSYRSQRASDGTWAPAPSVVTTYRGNAASGQLVFRVFAPDSVRTQSFAYVRASSAPLRLDGRRLNLPEGCELVPGETPFLLAR